MVFQCWGQFQLFEQFFSLCDGVGFWCGLWVLVGQWVYFGGEVVGDFGEIFVGGDVFQQCVDYGVVWVVEVSWC